MLKGIGDAVDNVLAEQGEHLKARFWRILCGKAGRNCVHRRQRHKPDCDEAIRR
jgi:hypothetical protein